MGDGLEQVSVRDERGRFVPGQSGNPAGKLPGTRNRATLLRAALDGEDGPAMARVIIDKAVAGDVVTARFCLDRLEPRPRSRAITIDLPEGARACDVLAAYDATVGAMMDGEITPDEAVQVTRVLDGRRKAIEAAWREKAREEARADTTEHSPSGARRDEGMALVVSDPNHLHFACISRSPPPSASSQKPREARAAQSRLSRPSSCERGSGGGFTADLLHSTCIARFPALTPGLAAGARVV